MLALLFLLLAFCLGFQRIEKGDEAMRFSFMMLDSGEKLGKLAVSPGGAILSQETGNYYSGVDLIAEG